jgi:hypothetical protein
MEVISTVVKGKIYVLELKPSYQIKYVNWNFPKSKHCKGDTNF